MQFIFNAMNYVIPVGIVAFVIFLACLIFCIIKKKAKKIIIILLIIALVVTTGGSVTQSILQKKLIEKEFFADGKFSDTLNSAQSQLNNLK